MHEKENKLLLLLVQINCVSSRDLFSLKVCFPNTDHVLLLGIVFSGFFVVFFLRLFIMCAFECTCKRWNFEGILDLPGFLASFSHALEKEIRSKYND